MMYFMEKSMEVPQKIKNTTVLWVVIPLLGLYPRNPNTILREKCTLISIVSLLTIAKIWKQPKCPSKDKWVRKLLYIYTMEYYLAIKKNDILPFATA